MKAVKVVLWALIIILLLAMAAAIFLWFSIRSLNKSEPAEIQDEVLYAAPCGVSLVLNVNPNWLEGDSASFDFTYKGKILSHNQIPNYPTWPQPEQPIETRPMGDGVFEVDVLARDISQSDFETAAQCVASNLPHFDDTLSTLGSHIPKKDRSLYTPYAIKSLVYVP